MSLWQKFAMPALCVGLAIPVIATPSLAATPTSAPSTGPWRSGLPSDAARQLQAEIDRQIALYGGTQVSAYEIAYGAGDPVMVFANPVTGEFPTDAANRVERGQATQTTPLTTAYRYGCPYSSGGWACFYQNIDFNGSGSGRLLQFQSCGRQSLATYGFSDQTSSWVNNTSSYVSVYDQYGTHLWDESPGGLSAYVGDANNDRADNFWIIC